MTNESAPAGGVPVDPPEPLEVGPVEMAAVVKRCAEEAVAPGQAMLSWLWRNGFRQTRRPAGGVVQPPADREVEALAMALAGRDAETWAATADDTRAFHVLIAQRGIDADFRRVPEGHHVVPDGRVWLDGRECEVLPKEHARNGDRTLDARFLRPVGAAGGEGTDGD